MTTLIKLEWLHSATALVTMQDTLTDNNLSENLVKDLSSIFTEIQQNNNAKAVILTGLASNFCVGALPETSSMTINDIAHLLLSCELPIIAAINGDALGDGFILSAFADILIMAEEANYATLSSTQSAPSLIAAYIIPKKFGILLGNELLYTAQKYTGTILKSRHAPVKIVSKDKVIQNALELAKNIDEKLVTSLRLLKQNFSQNLQQEMTQYFMVNKDHEKL